MICLFPAASTTTSGARFDVPNWSTKQSALGVGRVRTGNRRGRIQAHEDRAVAVAGQTAAGVGDRDRDLRGKHDRRTSQEAVRNPPLVVGTHGAEVEPPLPGLQERGIGRQDDLADGVRGAVMEPARHAVPERAQMLRVPAADVLARAEVLRRAEFLEDIVVSEAHKDPVSVNRGFGYDPGFMEVEVLEGVIHHAVRDLVAVMVAAGAAASALVHFQREELPAPLDLRGIRCRRELRKGVWQAPGLILGPEDLGKRHFVVPGGEGVSLQFGPSDGRRILRGLLPDKGIAGQEALLERLLREERRLPLRKDDLAVARGCVAYHIVGEPLEPLRPVVRDILVLRGHLRSAYGISADVPLVAVLAALPMAEGAGLVAVVGIGLGEEPAQPLFFGRGKEPGAVAGLGRVRGLVGHAHGHESLPRELAGLIDGEN